MSSDALKKVQEQRDKELGIERDAQGRVIIPGTGIVPRLGRKLNPNADLYNYRDLEAEDAVTRLAEEKMKRQQMQQMPASQEEGSSLGQLKQMITDSFSESPDAERRRLERVRKLYK